MAWRETLSRSARRRLYRGSAGCFDPLANAPLQLQTRNASARSTQIVLLGTGGKVVIGLDLDVFWFVSECAHRPSRAPAFASINEESRTVPFPCSSSPLWRGG